jgi:4-amino-4-deoxy-L-arabinose transferase-like glycosyltransferase
MSGLRSRVRAFLARVPPREQMHVAAAMAVSATLVIAYLLISPSHELSGDEPVYHEYGERFAAGELWHSSAPFGDYEEPGDERASAWKAPGYPAWVGVLYAVLPNSDEAVEVVQALLLAPLTVLLTWLLARRLLGPRVAIAAAWVTAVFPLSWEYFGLLFPEALAIPLTLGFLLAVLGREPTVRLAVITGVLLGLGLLVRPTSFFLVGAVAVAWWLAAGWRRGTALAALAIAVAALVVVPWTIRNTIVNDGGVIPISIQDAAAYGTFNSQSANDPDLPYAWRPEPDPYREELAALEREEPDDAELRDRLQELAWDYVKENPESVPAAFFRNGILRFWDLRSPGQALDEVDFQGRSHNVRRAGLAMYYVLLPLAVIGLWRLRRRREIVLPLLAAFALAAVAFTIIAATRYRAPLEPVLAILACSLLAEPWRLGPREEGSA